MNGNSRWNRVTEVLPQLDKDVLVLTRNGKICVNNREIPKDMYGNLIDGCLPRWKGNNAFARSIVAWMEIPDFKDILK